MYRLYKFAANLTNLGVSFVIFCLGVGVPVLLQQWILPDKPRSWDPYGPVQSIYGPWAGIIGVVVGIVLVIRYNRWRTARINKGYERMARKAGLEPSYSRVAEFGDGEQVFMIDIKNRKVFIVQNGKPTVVPFPEIVEHKIGQFDWRGIDGNTNDRYYLSIKTNNFETPEYRIILGTGRAACIEPHEKLRAALASA